MLHAWSWLITAVATAAPAPRHPAPPAREVTVVATDYRLAMPETLSAGPVELRVENRGRELHHVTLVRLLEGRTLSDLERAMRAAGPPPAWAVFVGGPNAVDPGGTSLETTVHLLPGRYAAICVIPGPDGVPHLMKGMGREVEVTPGVSPVSFDWNVDATVSLVDYGFRASQPITTHTRRVRVTNQGPQAHELVLVQLAPGKTMRDLAAWADRMQGPPPARFLGGVSMLAPGKENELSLALAPGHYAMLCFVPDSKDGKPHLAHGMVHDFQVRR